MGTGGGVGICSREEEKDNSSEIGEENNIKYHGLEDQKRRG